jgi:serine/threonine-protein kinase
MGEVFLARDQILDRDVALKVLRRQYAGDDEFAERFKREAMNAASLSHPNIVQVYDRGRTEDGAAYIAMEYVPGGTLKEKITGEGPLEPAVAASIGSQVAEALAAAHGKGVVHRDIKPQNVLLTGRGEAKVADFGIARAASAVTISQTGSVMGTASYMSPEQALGKPATPKSDLYSLGVVLYEAITGELPFTADNPIAVSMKHVNEPLRPPQELDPRIPDGMNALVVKLLSKDPEDRYRDANELADDLYRVRRGLAPAALATTAQLSAPMPPRASAQATTQATTVEAPAPAARPRKRRRLPFPVLLLALLALIGLGLILSSPFQDFRIADLLGGSGQTVEVPPVEGMTEDRAVDELAASGLEAEINRQQSSAAEAGVVLEQTPSGGERANKGSTVSLAVGSGPSSVQVPEVRGLSLADAEAELANAGLSVGNVSEIPSDTAPEGEVIEQGIEPGAAVESGTAVNLGISSGPSTVSSASSSASAPATSSASASSEPSASSASAAPAETPSSTPAEDPSSAAPSEEAQEEIQEKAEERQEKAAEKLEKAAEKAAEGKGPGE